MKKPNSLEQKDFKPSFKYQYIVIDTTNFFFKCYHSIIAGHEIKPEKIAPEQVSHIINLMLELTAYIKHEYAYEESEIYFLFDNSQSHINIRKLISEDYKSNRDKKNIPKNVYAILKLFSNIIKVYSNKYSLLFSDNLEADDLVMPLTEMIKPDHANKCLLVSDDMDWSRSITENTHWYNWKEIYDRDQFYRKYQFFPTIESVCSYKAFLGDASDSIPPAVSRTFSRKEFIEILNRYDDIESIIAAANRSEFSDKTNLEIIKSTKALRHNRGLIYFQQLKFPIENIVFRCKKDEFQVRVYLDSLNIEIPLEFQSRKEIEENFFLF